MLGLTMEGGGRGHVCDRGWRLEKLLVGTCCVGRKLVKFLRVVRGELARLVRQGVRYLVSS